MSDPGSRVRERSPTSNFCRNQPTTDVLEQLRVSAFFESISEEMREVIQDAVTTQSSDLRSPDRL